jgi:hypothetical protein
LAEATIGNLGNSAIAVLRNVQARSRSLEARLHAILGHQAKKGSWPV